MPCAYEESASEARERHENTRRIAASLCAVLTFAESWPTPIYGIILDNLDYEEAGITREWLEAWWAKHKEEDAGRRERERQAAADADTRKRALAKLTPEERRAFGLEPKGP